MAKWPQWKMSTTRGHNSPLIMETEKTEYTVQAAEGLSRLTSEFSAVHIIPPVVYVYTISSEVVYLLVLIAYQVIH